MASPWPPYCSPVPSPPATRRPVSSRHRRHQRGPPPGDRPPVRGLQGLAARGPGGDRPVPRLHPVVQQVSALTPALPRLLGRLRQGRGPVRLRLGFRCATPATPSAPDRLFLNVCCIFLQLVEESLYEWRNEEVSCCQNCKQALPRTDGLATRKMQSKWSIRVDTNAAVLLLSLELFNKDWYQSSFKGFPIRIIAVHVVCSVLDVQCFGS